MMPEWLSKFFSVKIAALVLGLWFVSQTDDWRHVVAFSTISIVFIIGKTIQNCVESYCTKTREEKEGVK